MPLSWHTERLNGGLRNKPDPTELQNGELQQADDCYYEINDTAIRRITGRNAFGSPIGTRVNALHHLPFDDAAGVVLARSGGSYFSAGEDEENVTFSAVTLPAAISAAEQQTMAHHSNKFFILDGENRNLVATKTLTADPVAGSKELRFHGMLPVENDCSVEINTDDAAAVWYTPVAEFPLNVYYWYWTTEYDSENDLESTYDGTVQAAKVTAATGQRVAVVPPEPRNTNADKWRVYRSSITTERDDEKFRPPLITGQLITELAFDQAGIFYDHAVDNSNPYTPPTTTDAPYEWTNPTGVFVENDGDAASSNVEGQEQGYGGFGLDALPGIDDPILGIAVRLRLRRTNFFSAGVAVQLSSDAGASWTDPKQVRVGNTYMSVVLGGKTDLWGRTWLLSDLTDANFRVKIRSFHSRVEVEVDYLAVKVWWAAPLDESSDVYPAVAVTFANVTQVVSRNGQPPTATAGAYFEDSLVLNDVSDPSLIRYSFPGEPDYFPSVYFLSLETDKADEVVALHSTQDRLVVGLKRHLIAIDYLPMETDLNFSRGRAWRIISPDFGVVGPQAITSLQMEGQPALTAFIDLYQGLCVTDSYRAWSITSGLAWDKMINPSMAHRFILLNYPKWSALILYYASPNSSVLDRRMIFHYHPSHIQRGGSLKVTGPCSLPEGGAAEAMRVGSTVTHLYGDNAGQVWVEDRGALGRRVKIQMVVRTREMPIVGIGREFIYERFLIRYIDAVDSRLAFDVTNYRTGKLPAPVVGVLRTVSGRNYRRHNIRQQTEAIDMVLRSDEVRPTDSAGTPGIALEHITVGYTSYGPEE